MGDTMNTAETIRIIREELSAMGHVIIESAFRPGIDSKCRCHECRLVAQKMDGAGFLDDVTDRWWEQSGNAGEGTE